MSSIGDYLFGLKNQLNPLDHGKTAANPTGLPAGVPTQIPRLDTQAPSYSLGRNAEPIPTTSNPAPKAKTRIPVFGTNGTLQGYNVSGPTDFFGNPVLPPALFPKTFEPLQMGAGDYELQTLRDYMVSPNHSSNPQNELPIYLNPPTSVMRRT